MSSIYSSLQNENSRYISGGKSEYNSVGITYWDRAIFSFDDTDFIHLVESKDEGRLDNITDRYYGNNRDWWIIAMYNNILDPFSEIFEGRILRIPSIERKNKMLLKSNPIKSTAIPVSTISPIIL